MEILLCPEPTASLMQEAVQNFDLRNPDDGQLFPKELPRESFPLLPDFKTKMVYAAWSRLLVPRRIPTENVESSTSSSDHHAKWMSFKIENCIRVLRRIRKRQEQSSRALHSHAIEKIATLPESQGENLHDRRSSIDNGSKDRILLVLALLQIAYFQIASASSLSSVSGHKFGSEPLISLLRDDSTVSSLLVDGLTSMDSTRFERNLKNLFRKLARDLRREATTWMENDAADAADSILYLSWDLAHIICNQVRALPIVDSLVDLKSIFSNNLCPAGAIEPRDEISEDEESSSEYGESSSHFREGYVENSKFIERERLKKKVKEAVKGTELSYAKFARYMVVLALEELFRWEPRVSDQYTRVRWKCVSSIRGTTPSS